MDINTKRQFGCKSIKANIQCSYRFAIDDIGEGVNYFFNVGARSGVDMGRLSDSFGNSGTCHGESNERFAIHIFKGGRTCFVGFILLYQPYCYFCNFGLYEAIGKGIFEYEKAGEDNYQNTQKDNREVFVFAFIDHYPIVAFWSRACQDEFMGRAGFVLLVLVIAGVIIFSFKNPTRLTENNTAGIINGSAKPASKRVFINETSLDIPDGFGGKMFAKGLSAPRVIIFDPKGNVMVSIPSKGVVVALPDRDKNGEADEIVTVAEGLNNPHGILFLCKSNRCQLYVAEENQLDVFDYNQERLVAGNKRKLINLPDGGNHVTRSLALSPNPGKLLVAIGSSCNVCNESDERRAAILEVDVETVQAKVFAKGLRNSVFMTTRPGTNEVWATDMGRDWLGDNSPPDEINMIRDGKTYGWPYCYGKGVHDANFDPGGSMDCSQTEPARVEIPAHSAPLGLAFWGSDLLVAYHGSWNRTTPTGYKIVKIDKDKKITDFVTGFIDGGKVTGRPVGVLAGEKKIYITDDRAGVVYLIYE